MNGIAQGSRHHTFKNSDWVLHTATKESSYYLLEKSEKMGYIRAEKYEFGILLYRYLKENGEWLENYKITPESPDYKRLERYQIWENVKILS